MTKSIISTIITISMFFAFTASASAINPAGLSTADALLVLRASAGLITLTDEQFARYDMNGDGAITTADVLMILRFIAEEQLTTDNECAIDNLSEAAELKLLENWAAYLRNETGLAAGDYKILYYYGTFDGREVVVIFPKGWGMTADMQYIEIAGYTIALGSGSLQLMVHDDGTFVPIRDAYEQGLLTADDIKLIANPPNQKSQPQRAPSLEVSSGRQSVQALQLTTSWIWKNADGTGGGYEADSPHALQLPQSEFDRASIALAAVNNEMILLFSDNLQPDSIIVRRWRAEHGGRQDLSAVLDLSEIVSVNGNVIPITNNGQSYIYEVEASWEQGRSRYTFRVAGG